MLEIKGKYNTAKVYTDLIEPEAVSQIMELLNQEIVKNETFRLMPDCHAGAGCVIGTTLTVTSDKLIPNLVGVDIFCGVDVTNLGKIDVDLPKLDEFIRNNIPMGFNIRKDLHTYAKDFQKKKVNLSNLRCANKVDITKGYYSIGSLGGGNHFVELDKDSEGNIYLVIHSGSRHLGYEVAKYYQEQAYLELNRQAYDVKAKREGIVRDLKAKGRQSEIKKALDEELLLRKTKFTPIPKELAYLQGSLFSDYVSDMNVLREFAYLNRKAMAKDILDFLGVKPIDEFTTLHNYLDTENMILRKGAVSAQSGEKLIIPINMRDGSLICIGKGNSDWNYSAPHGAGRIMSRSEAKRRISLDEFSESMKGIYSSSVVASVIDESPMAYKPLESILENIKDTVDVVNVIKPIYNAKAKEV